MALSLVEAAKKVLCPDSKGWSRVATLDEFIAYDSRLRLGNGGSWCGSDRGLGLEFIVRRYKGRDDLTKYKYLKDKGLVKGLNSIIAVQLCGYRKNIKSNTISNVIKKYFKHYNCCVLDIGTSLELDHKDGRKDDWNVNNVSKQTINDFQVLNKTVNDAKRQHCSDCKRTGIRFDARRLGYCVPQWIGDEHYNGSCVGCYWHDPKEFNHEVSSSYIIPYKLNDILIKIVSKDLTWQIKMPLVCLSTICSLDVIRDVSKLKISEFINVKSDTDSYVIHRIQ